MNKYNRHLDWIYLWKINATFLISSDQKDLQIMLDKVWWWMKSPEVIGLNMFLMNTSKYSSGFNQASFKSLLELYLENKWWLVYYVDHAFSCVAWSLKKSHISNVPLWQINGLIFLDILSQHTAHAKSSYWRHIHRM